MTAAQKRSFGSRSIQILSFCAMICAWLIAGTFFAFSDFVMFALEQLEPEVGIAAMQAMNVTVEEHFFVLAATDRRLGIHGWSKTVSDRWSCLHHWRGPANAVREHPS